MKSRTFWLSCTATLLALIPNTLALSNSSAKLLPTSFEPPQVFENVNLVRNVNLKKSFPRETVNVVIQNVDMAPRDEYYWLVPSNVVANIGGFDARDKDEQNAGPFQVELAQSDASGSPSYYIIKFRAPLMPKAQMTLTIKYNVLSSLTPLPAQIEQMAQQTVEYTFTPSLRSAYKSRLQKTKFTLPSSKLDFFTKLDNPNADGAPDPTHQGPSLTYGPYKDVTAGQTNPAAKIRYEFTHPLTQATLLERDVEVSHWGGNLAFEERYWLSNRAAQLKNHFSRLQYQMSNAYGSSSSTAVRELRIPLRGGAMSAYFWDEIGNVSTSRFASGKQSAMLDIKPRYPMFGGWNYSFKIGWDNDLAKFLKGIGGEEYALRVPFMEGPNMSEGVAYEKVVVRVVLPEGAKNVRYKSPVPLVSSNLTNHFSFMDSKGRPTVVMTAVNAVDEWRDRGDIVVVYEYPWLEGYRKPLTIAAGMFCVYVGFWIVGNINFRIGKTK